MTGRSGSALVAEIGEVTAASGMRIVSVETVLLSHHLADEDVISWSGGSLPGFTAGLVRISTDDGVVGIGESYAGFFAPEVMSTIVDFYRPLLLARDPSHVAELWELCYSRSLYWGRTGINVSVLSAIESALWDLCGKAVGVPVHQLLGGTRHDSLPIYASGGMDNTDDAFVSEQRHHLADGYRASKIRIGHGAVADVHKVQLARETLGEKIALAADAVQGSNPKPWDADVAIEVGHALTPYGLVWLEEPCAADDVEGYRRVRAAVDIPIAGGETCTTAEQLIALINQDCFGIAQPDATHIGGLLPVLRVSEAAEVRGVPLAMHVWGCGVGMMANYHVGFAAGSTAWLEHPAVGNPMRDALLAEPLRIVDGRVMPSTAPGLGVRLTPEIEERFAYVAGTRYRFGEQKE